MLRRERHAVRHLVWFGWVVLLSANVGLAEEAKRGGEFSDRTITDEAGEHRYVIYTPPSFDRTQTYPLVLFFTRVG